MANGRRSLYEKDIKKEALEMARLGLTNAEIARVLGVHERNFQRWLAKYPEFRHVLQEGKDQADREVERSLFKRAIGYSYVERTFEKAEESGRMRLTKKVTKEVAPDTVAALQWLYNRMRSKWKDVRHMTVAGDRHAPPIMLVPVTGKVEQIGDQNDEKRELEASNERSEGGKG